MNKEKVNSEQHYALDSQNRLVNIRDIEEGKKLYFCPYCKGEMIPKRGKIRDWHFAHKCLTENCSYESYLHSLAKLRLCEWFNNTTNAIIHLESKHICSLFDECFWRKNAKDFECSNMTHKPWNLKKYYTNCEIEKQYGNYRADLFLAYKGEKDEPIFIEICVTHPCSEDKVKSGIRIIEFKIESEKDIDDIIKHPIQKGDKTNIYNFKSEPDKQFEPQTKLRKFILDKFHRISVENIGCKDAQLHHRGIFEMTIRQSALQKTDNLYDLGVIAAKDRGIDVRFCELCKWQDEKTKIVACKQYKKAPYNEYKDNEKAWRCPEYELDEEFCINIQERLNETPHDSWKAD